MDPVALEVLIVSDILHSIVHWTLDEIAFLAGTTTIRATLAFSWTTKFDSLVSRMCPGSARNLAMTKIGPLNE